MLFLRVCYRQMGSRGGGTTDTPFLRNYRLGKTLGHGAFGKVKVAEHLLTGHNVAIKILNRQKMRNLGMEEKLRREIRICRLFVHPHVIRLYEVIETPTDIYVVMEYGKSGELFDYIMEKRRLQEDEARHIFQQIVAGVEYCHRNRVVHRDLKPENVLLDARGNVKIADFGLSNIMRDGHFLKTSCGSPNYAAPEVVSGKLYAGPEVDVWGCGVILYALLCGKLPFEDENIPNLFKKIQRGIYTLPSHLSPGARDLIPRMLIVDPMMRTTIADIRQHQWFKIHLPRYLAVPPPDSMQLLKKLDEEILQQVIRMGFDRDQLLESLQKRMQDDATVAYYLLYDNHSLASGSYLGAEFQESMDGYSPGSLPNLDRQLSAENGTSQAASLRHSFSKEKKWLVGLQSPANPREIMNQVLGTLHELNVRWKKVGHYNMKCLWCQCHGLDHLKSMASNHVNNYQFISNATSMSTHLQPQTALKFEMQLYKTQNDRYLLDLQRISGPQFLFLDFCAVFIMQLKAPQ
ncbi:SNF1-related protein kinase catalytic subunit alpha KIN10 isoform X1 [Nicotiana tabacum]|uniref:non-specific serine/threonine protein kinase n=2 Tax=Nicotiana tabacum TaxID=4097 RepID=A0A1S3YWS0_TOBAC|nr:PREDICTED: SNF1-related protein kinase catalytic subunit alpha KIN10-like isoform X1 [Nicotiana tabacum]